MSSRVVRLSEDDIVLILIMIKAYEESKYSLTVAHEQRMAQLKKKLKAQE